MSGEDLLPVKTAYGATWGKWKDPTQLFDFLSTGRYCLMLMVVLIVNLWYLHQLNLFIDSKVVP